MVKATIDALLKTRAPKSVAAKRGKKINEIVARREAAEGREVKEVMDAGE